MVFINFFYIRVGKISNIFVTLYLLLIDQTLIELSNEDPAGQWAIFEKYYF